MVISKKDVDLTRYMTLYYQELIERFVAACKESMGDKLVGIYLHGSLAMGCFHPDTSDIDLLVVISAEITNKDKMQFMERVVDLNQYAPAKGIEVSIVLEQYCKSVVYPTPFELHFSPMHLQWFREKPQHYVENMKGVDTDLVAHFAITKAYGKELYGKPIPEVFGEVKKEDYLESIWEDIADAEKEVKENPVYIVLNLCRALAYKQEDLILSKETGGKWGITHLEQTYHPLIKEALNCYCTNEQMQEKEEVLTLFVRYMLQNIQ